MKSTNILTTAILAAAGLALSTTPAAAQNPGYQLGDLILGFQVSGGTGAGSYLLANLGSAAAIRDSAVNLTLANVGASLSSKFGAGWADRTDLFMGSAMGFEFDEFGTYGDGSGGLNGDSWNTSYVSAKRTSVGTVGSAGSFAWSLGNAATTNQAAQGTKAAAEGFETLGLGAVSVIPNGILPINWNVQNPVSGTSQGVAFNGVFAGGVQTTFGAGLFGNLGGFNAEAALDLYRIQGANSDPGTIGFGLNNQGSSTYEGSIVIDSAGVVSLAVVPVPEPSALGIYGFGAGLTALLRRRRGASAKA